MTLTVCTLCAADIPGEMSSPVDVRPVVAPFVDACDRCGERSQLAYRVTPYPVVVRFTRAFTRGNLAGLSYRDAHGVTDEQAAQRWVAGIAREDLDYRLDSVTIERV